MKSFYLVLAAIFIASSFNKRLVSKFIWKDQAECSLSSDPSTRKTCNAGEHCVEDGKKIKCVQAILPMVECASDDGCSCHNQGQEAKDFSYCPKGLTCQRGVDFGHCGKTKITHNQKCEDDTCICTGLHKSGYDKVEHPFNCLKGETCYDWDNGPICTSHVLKAGEKCDFGGDSCICANGLKVELDSKAVPCFDKQVCSVTKDSAGVLVPVCRNPQSIIFPHQKCERENTGCTCQLLSNSEDAGISIDFKKYCGLIEKEKKLVQVKNTITDPQRCDREDYCICEIDGAKTGEKIVQTIVFGEHCIKYQGKITTFKNIRNEYESCPAEGTCLCVPNGSLSQLARLECKPKGLCEVKDGKFFCNGIQAIKEYFVCKDEQCLCKINEPFLCKKDEFCYKNSGNTKTCGTQFLTPGQQCTDPNGCPCAKQFDLDGKTITTSCALNEFCAFQKWTESLTICVKERVSVNQLSTKDIFECTVPDPNNQDKVLSYVCWAKPKEQYYCLYTPLMNGAICAENKVIKHGGLCRGNNCACEMDGQPGKFMYISQNDMCYSSQKVGIHISLDINDKRDFQYCYGPEKCVCFYDFKPPNYLGAPLCNPGQMCIKGYDGPACIDPWTTDEDRLTNTPHKDGQSVCAYKFESHKYGNARRCKKGSQCIMFRQELYCIADPKDKKKDEIVPGETCPNRQVGCVCRHESKTTDCLASTLCEVSDEKPKCIQYEGVSWVIPILHSFKCGTYSSGTLDKTKVMYCVYGMVNTLKEFPADPRYFDNEEKFQKYYDNIWERLVKAGRQLGDESRAGPTRNLAKDAPPTIV